MRKFLLVMTVFMSSLTLAEKVYLGVNLGVLSSEVPDWSGINVKTLNLTVGAQLFKGISGELRYGRGVQGGSAMYEFGDLQAQFDIDDTYGAYLCYSVAISEHLRPYGVVGYSRTGATGRAEGIKISESSNNKSYGLGVDIGLAKGVILNTEYIKYARKEGSTTSGFLVGFRWVM